MMQFPVITNIDQVREAIKGRDEFFEADKGDYIVFNYMVAYNDSFNCPVRRECRGLIFCKHTGKVLSRRFHKFFNMGEKEETQPEYIDFSKPHVILDKLDGSMITPLIFSKEDVDGTHYDIRWATKMGTTEVAEMAEKFVKSKRDQENWWGSYEIFSMSLFHGNMTPIFEYTGPYNRIVLDHQEESLVLLAIRNNETGKYLSYDDMKTLAFGWDIPVVQPYQGTIDDLARATDIEGVVIRFEDGHMIKVKTDWYVAIHKAKENILFERNVLRLILEEKIDDIIPHLPEKDRLRLEDYQTGVHFSIGAQLGYMHITKEIIRKNLKTRKEFALNDAKLLHPFTRKLCFMVWDMPNLCNEDMRRLVVHCLLRLCSSQVDIDANRDILGVKWNPTGDIEHEPGKSSS